MDTSHPSNASGYHFVQPNIIESALAPPGPPTHVPIISGVIVDVQAGLEGKIFYVHKDILDAAPFTHNAMKNRWREAKRLEKQETWLDLTPHRPDMVEKYIQWLYSHNIPAGVTPTELVDLYVFGDELMHDEFVNAVLNRLKMMNSSNTRPFTIDLIHKIYRMTKNNSPIRQLAVDSFAWYESINAATIETLQKEFMKDLLHASMKKKDNIYHLPP